MKYSIDLPQDGADVEPLSVRARGWIVLAEDKLATFSELRIVCGGKAVARVDRLLWRPDVAAAHALPNALTTGFDSFFALPDARPGSTATLEFWVDLADGSSHCFGSRTVRLAEHDYAHGLFREFLDQRTTDPRRRSDIFRSGPPSPEPSLECLGLLTERLAQTTHGRILDVGCGIGSYALPLQRKGFAWTGVEVDPACCERLEQAGLPFRRGDGMVLPFEDGAFDAALCIEVLEHTETPDAMVQEIRRVAREAVFSVPNCELIPYFAAQLATPWHMLEPDHRNFFSRWSLEALLRRHFKKVEVTAYGTAPLRSVDGAELFYHLLAHAR